MQFLLHPEARSFLAAAGAFLAAREVENGLLRDIAAAVLEKGLPASLVTVEDAGAVVGLAVQTPPRNLVLSHLPAGAGARLADFLHASGAVLPGALGPVDAVEEFGRRWSELTGASVSPGMRENLYRCDRLVEPPAVPGALRPARPDEAEAATEWSRRFVTEVGLSEEELKAAGEMTRAAIAAGRLWWWDDGGPVAMTAVASETDRLCRINSVMTRPDRRGRGYGAAVVAAVTRLCLARGRSCYLHADAANPVSNGLYRRLGYELLAVEQELRFLVNI